MRFRIQGSGIRVSDVRFRIQGLGFRTWAIVSDAGFQDQLSAPGSQSCLL